MLRRQAARFFNAAIAAAFAAALAFVCSSAVVHASASPAQHFALPKASAPPPITLPIAPAAWQGALQARDFEDFTARRSAEVETVAYLTYDNTALYVAFHCVQAGIPVTALQQIDHAGVGTDDHVSLGIDTSGNGTRTYAFRVNPIGVHDESSTENARYAPSWTSIARVDAAGNYDAVLVIPLADIRAQAAPVQQWRFNFERFVAARNADLTWAYEPAMQSIASVQFWPWLTGIRVTASATRPKPQADAYVLGSAGSQHDVFQNGIGEFQQMAPRAAGLDVTYPFTNTLAFVGTLNPDFSNVEQDQTTIELQEFQKAYTEYRPFFSQGAQYINAIPQFGMFGSNSLFYTPSIGVFNRGLKIEGTAGSNAVGLLNVVGPGIDDDAAGYAYTLPDGTAQFSLESILANHAGVRDDTDALGFTRLNPHSGEQTSIEFASEDDSLSGESHDFNFEEQLRNQHFNVSAYYRDTSLDYGPLDGYTATNDARGPQLTLGYNGTGSPSSPLEAYSFSAFADRYLASDGSVREADLNGFYNVQFKDLISVQGFFGPSELQVAPGLIEWFNRRQIELGYKASTPQPFTATYAWGPFGGFFVQQTQLSDARVAGPYTLALEYDGNLERSAPGAPVFNSQWLRRVEFTRSFGRDSSVGLELRSINGTGGFAVPGTDLSMLYRERFANQDLLYLEFSTPAATQTLHRFIVKYVFHAGGSTGT